MTKPELTQLAGLYAMYAAYYRQAVPDEVLKMYTTDLEDFEFAVVREALEAYRRNPSNRTMPLPAMIRAQLQPGIGTDGAAREIAARITAAIPKYGWSNASAAQAYIGEVGWQVVGRQGGWPFICEHHGVKIDPTSFQAQTRELAKSILTHNPTQMAKVIGIMPGIKVGEIQSIQEIIALLPAPKPEDVTHKSLLPNETEGA